MTSSISLESLSQKLIDMQANLYKDTKNEKNSKKAISQEYQITDLSVSIFVRMKSESGSVPPKGVAICGKLCIDTMKILINSSDKQIIEKIRTYINEQWSIWRMDSDTPLFDKFSIKTSKNVVCYELKIGFLKKF